MYLATRSTGNRYILHRYISKKVTILYSQTQVDVYYRYEHIATHGRARRPYSEQAYQTCQGIINYASRVGPARLNAACARALFYGDYSYKTIVAILEKRLDQLSMDTEQVHTVMPLHKNIRGEDYYA